MTHYALKKVYLNCYFELFKFHFLVDVMNSFSFYYFVFGVEFFWLELIFNSLIWSFVFFFCCYLCFSLLVFLFLFFCFFVGGYLLFFFLYTFIYFLFFMFNTVVYLFLLYLVLLIYAFVIFIYKIFNFLLIQFYVFVIENILTFFFDLFLFFFDLFFFSFMLFVVQVEVIFLKFFILFFDFFNGYVWRPFHLLVRHNELFNWWNTYSFGYYKILWANYVQPKFTLQFWIDWLQHFFYFTRMNTKPYFRKFKKGIFKVNILFEQVMHIQLSRVTFIRDTVQRRLRFKVLLRLQYLLDIIDYHPSKFHPRQISYQHGLTSLWPHWTDFQRDKRQFYDFTYFVVVGWIFYFIFFMLVFWITLIFNFFVLISNIFFIFFCSYLYNFQLDLVFAYVYDISWFFRSSVDVLFWFFSSTARFLYKFYLFIFDPNAFWILTNLEFGNFYNLKFRRTETLFAYLSRLKISDYYLMFCVSYCKAYLFEFAVNYFSFMWYLTWFECIRYCFVFSLRYCIEIFSEFALFSFLVSLLQPIIFFFHSFFF